MTRLNASLAVALLTALASAQSGGLPADFVKLVPEDAVIVVELRSADELAREAESFRARVAPDQAPVTGKDLLARLGGELDLPGDAAELDTTQPIGFALRRAGRELAPTFIVPTRDSTRWIESTEGSPEQLSFASSGAYVACTLGELPPAAAKAPRLLEAWPGSALTVRVDAARLIASYRLEIDAALGQFEQLIEAGAFDDEEAPVDMTEILDLYLQYAQDFVASADVVEATLDARDGDYSLAGTLRNKAGSPLAKHASAERVDYRDLARRLEPGAALQFIGSYDQSELAELSSEMYEVMLEDLEQTGLFAEPLTDVLHALLRHVSAFQKQVGRVTGMSMDLDARGMRLVGVFAPPDPAGLEATWRAYFAEPAFASIGMLVEGPQPVQLAGVTAQTWKTALDWRRMLQLVPEGERAEVEELLPTFEQVAARAWGGKQYTFAVLRADPRVAFVAGGDDAWRASAAQRALAGGEPSKALARLAARLEGANPAYGMHADVSRVLGAIADLFEGTPIAEQDTDDTLATLRAFGAQPLPISFHWGVTPAAWTARFDVGADGARFFAERMHALAELELRKGAANRDLVELSRAVEQYASEHDAQVPPDLAALTAKGADGEPYLAVLPTDPWGRAYLYTLAPDGRDYAIRTLGADGKEGGRGENSDLSSEQLPKWSDVIDETAGEMDDEELSDDEESDGDEE